MDTPVWVPLTSVVAGGLLTIISSLTVEIFRDRIRERRDVRSRRRSKLEEMERAVLDAHTKITTSEQLIAALEGTRRKPTASEGRDLLEIDQSEKRSDDLLIALSAGSSGKVEVLRAVGLAARVGTLEIRQLVSEYAAVQLRWSQSPTSTGVVVDTMDQNMTQILELIAEELRQLDQADLMSSGSG